MKSVIRIGIILGFLFVMTTNVIAEIKPVVILKEGTNEVAISVNNNWDKDISSLELIIDKENVPKWLNIHTINQTINIPKQMQGTEKFILSMDVTDKPSDTFVEIPIILKDNKRNVWNSSLKVVINSNKESELPVANALYENYPNPFNPVTTIKYSLIEEKHAKLVVYNSLGQEIRTLVDTLQKPGIHTTQWNGINDNGQKVSAGLYFFRLTAGSFVQTRKMMLME